MKNILTWLLLGMLVPSVAVNLRHWCSCEDPTPATSSSCEICGSGGKVDLDALGLTPAQTKALQESCSQCTQLQGSDNDEGKKKVAELLSALRAGTVDKNRIRKLGAELAEVRKRQVVENVDALLRVREVLTAEQLERLPACCDPK